ncbi:glycosyltransferase family 4 protein [Bordetella bronchiseptica]|uniref:glycosyltransferase family 4 protein n=1 Tax=Bordetella bronchiseptica TaxID=518 RepID=UPI00028F8CD3|nr:glycosyltransferase family 4 protein [Bordetella bronchiseptica]CCN21003.1 putative glycosyl transferase [Bordetella bronchiseptica 1289]
MTQRSEPAVPALRILHTEAATGAGGQETSIYREMLAMRARGHHLEAACQPGAPLARRLRAAGFPVHELAMDGVAAGVRAVWRLRELVRGRFDVVNTHSRRDTVLAAWAGRMAGAPLIVRTRHLAKPVGSLYTYTWLPHRVIAVSDHVRGQILRAGARAAHVEAIASPATLAPAPPASSLRAELGIAAAAQVIGCVAVMRADKGLDDLLDAFVALAGRHAAVHLVLVGEPGGIGALLRERAQRLGLGARVHLTGHRDDIPNVLAAFDVFALPTRSEALGLAMVEAAAAGLPVVAGNVGGVPEVVRHGATGLLVPPSDPAALAQALERLLVDPALRRAMGRAGSRMVRDERDFSPERQAARVEAAYCRWLAQRGRPAWR